MLPGLNFAKNASCSSVTCVFENNNFISFPNVSNYNEFYFVIANIQNSEILKNFPDLGVQIH